MDRATRGEVERWLKSGAAIDFPATKDQIVAALEQAAAPEPVVRAVRAIAPERYDRRDQVTAATDVEPDEPTDPTTEALRRRVKGRVALDERDVDLPALHDESRDG